MPRDIQQAVRETCLWMPETEESLSHGSVSFKIRRKTFAYYLVNHHGDGRVALWINAGSDTQQACVGADPASFSYRRTWVIADGSGINLDKGLAWQRVADLVRNAYERSAPRALLGTLGKTPRIKAPERALAAGQVDPLKSTSGKALVEALRGICLDLPEVSEITQFGYPAWAAGRRTFAMARAREGRPIASFWVGVDRQLLLTADERFAIPPYIGHKGWIDLAAAGGFAHVELQALALESYRHFALQRMLKRLPPGA